MYHFIINPIASSGKGEKVWKEVKILLDNKNIQYDFTFTTKEKNAKYITNKITYNLQKHLTIVVLGGDGTLNEAINGIKNLSFITLGIIPVGSGNDFIRSFKNKTDLDGYVNRIINPSKILSYNIGKMKNSFSERKFIVSSGIGFDASITNEVNNDNFRKYFKIKLFHKLSYVIATIKALFKYKKLDMDISIDGNTKYFKDVYFCIIMNTCYEGKAVEFCPDAIGYDDILDICVIHTKNIFKLIFLALRAYSGNHIKSKDVYISKGEDFKIKASAITHCHADGEQVGQSDWADFNLLKEKIKVIIE